jgi:hypothetical protein
MNVHLKILIIYFSSIRLFIVIKRCDQIIGSILSQTSSPLSQLSLDSSFRSVSCSISSKLTVTQKSTRIELVRSRIEIAPSDLTKQLIGFILLAESCMRKWE